MSGCVSRGRKYITGGQRGGRSSTNNEICIMESSKKALQWVVFFSLFLVQFLFLHLSIFWQDGNNQGKPGIVMSFLKTWKSCTWHFAGGSVQQKHFITQRGTTWSSCEVSCLLSLPNIRKYSTIITTYDWNSSMFTFPKIFKGSFFSISWNQRKVKECCRN